MGKYISKDKDLVTEDAPKCASGYNSFEDPGIMPSESPIADSKEMSAQSVYTKAKMDGGLPKGKKGSGFTD